MVKIIGIIILITSVLFAGVDKKETIEEVLKDTEGRAKILITKRLQKFNEYIDNVKKNTKVFADELMSIKSMWLYLRSKLPFTEKKIYSEHIISLFKKYFFTLEDLKTSIKMNLNHFLKDLEALENILAVNLQRILIDNNTGNRLNLKSITEELNGAINDTLSLAEQVNLKDITRLIAVEVTTVIGVVGLNKFVVSVGVLTAGALSSWTTFGASIVIGITVERIWKKIDNPEGKIIKKLTVVMDNIKARITKNLKNLMKRIVQTKILKYRQILKLWKL